MKKVKIFLVAMLVMSCVDQSVYAQGSNWSTGKSTTVIAFLLFVPLSISMTQKNPLDSVKLLSLLSPINNL